MCKLLDRFHKTGLSIACSLIAFAAPVLAGPCPDSFSFVDLGQVDTSGSIRPGGPAFRVMQHDRTLLARPPSCDRQSDGVEPLFDDAGDPIPRASGVAYSPSTIASDVGGFGVTRATGQAARLAAMNAPTVAAARDDPTIDRTTGSGFVCYSRVYNVYPSVICEVDNPFDSTKPIYMSCDAGDCSIIGIFMSPDLLASVDWSGDYASPMAVGVSAVEVVSDIHSFLVSQMVN